jgi:hypothetical protein
MGDVVPFPFKQQVATRTAASRPLREGSVVILPVVRIERSARPKRRRAEARRVSPSMRLACDFTTPDKA